MSVAKVQSDDETSMSLDHNFADTFQPITNFWIMKMAAEPSTRQRLHSVIDDMELISKELIEQLAMPKSQKRADAPDTTDLMELLIEKDSEVKELLKIAEEQEKVQKVMDGLRAEVNKRDGEIRQLQRALKEAETIMATAVYQAKQKLAAVRQSQNSRISSEELIKYAHRISASNAVAAPPTWSSGDARRPYPTDLEMRHSFLSLGAFPETSATATPASAVPVSRLYSQDSQPSSHQHHQVQQQPGLGHHHHHQPHHKWEQGIPSTYSWPSSQEPPMSLASHHSISDSLKGHSKEEDDVELMSSDSSSSSSSDE